MSDNIPPKKYYAEAIKRCTVKRRKGGIYFLECRIMQYGCREYCYTPGDSFIKKAYSQNKRLYLSDNALCTVTDAIQEYDRLTETIMSGKGGYTRVPFEELGLELYYATCDQKSLKEGYCETGTYKYEESMFNVLYVCPERKTYEYCPRIGLRDLLWGLWQFSSPTNIGRFVNPKAENMKSHPLYMSAVSNGDRYLQHRMELLCDCVTNETIAYLSEYYGLKLLQPPEPGGPDRDFYLYTEEIDFDLMRKSGYTILHVPVFSMKGKTHMICTVNPHSRTIKDAAPKNALTIPWDEFMSILDTSY